MGILFACSSAAILVAIGVLLWWLVQQTQPRPMPQPPAEPVRIVVPAPAPTFNQALPPEPAPEPDGGGGSDKGPTTIGPTRERPWQGCCWGRCSNPARRGLALGHTRRMQRTLGVAVGVLSGFGALALVAGSGCAQNFNGLFLDGGTDGGPGDTEAVGDSGGPADTGGMGADTSCRGTVCGNGMCCSGSNGSSCIEPCGCCRSSEICSGGACCTPEGGSFHGGGGGNPCCASLQATAGGTCEPTCLPLEAGCTSASDNCCAGGGNVGEYCGTTNACEPCVPSFGSCTDGGPPCCSPGDSCGGGETKNACGNNN